MPKETPRNQAESRQPRAEQFPKELLEQRLEKALLELYETYRKEYSAKDPTKPSQLENELHQRRFGVTRFEKDLQKLSNDSDGLKTETDEKFKALAEARAAHSNALKAQARPVETPALGSQAWDFTKKAAPYVGAAVVGMFLAGPVGAVVLTGAVYGGKRMIGAIAGAITGAGSKEVKIHKRPVDPRIKWKAEAQAKKDEPKARSDTTLSDTDSHASSTTVSRDDDDASVLDTFHDLTNSNSTTGTATQNDNTNDATANEHNNSSSNTFGSGR